MWVRLIHLLHYVLEHRIGYIADEQVMLRVSIGQKMLVYVRVITQHASRFRVITHHKQLRGFTHQ